MTSHFCYFFTKAMKIKNIINLKKRNMKLILNMEVENWDTFNKVYILGDNSNKKTLV